MSAIWARKISIYFLIILLCAPMGIASSTMPPAPSSQLHFHKSDTSSDYIGSLVSASGSWRLEDVRITLYNHYKQPIETGLLSEYSRNSSYGNFLGYRDNNINGKLDGADTFYVYENGEVLPSWGIELTHERTGSIISSSTLSGDNFSIEDKKEPDDRILIRYTVLTLMILNLLIILAVVYKMPCV